VQLENPTKPERAVLVLKVRKTGEKHRETALHHLLTGARSQLRPVQKVRGGIKGKRSLCAGRRDNFGQVAGPMLVSDTR
jgi:hypothetical protein